VQLTGPLLKNVLVFTLFCAIGATAQEVADVTLQIGNHPEEGRLLALIDGEGDPLANVQLVSSSSSTGLVDLLQGDTQMALSTRPPRPNEADAFQKSGLGEIQGRGQEFILGLESVLIVTAPQNPIQSISDKTAAQIFSGAITNWAELGGADLPIQVYIRDIESDTGDAFNSLLMAPQSQQMRDDATVVSDDARLAARVATDPAGIGFVRFDPTPEALPRLKEMVRAMADSTQLSLSFRFVPGTNKMDARSFQDLERLASLLATDEYAQKTVTLASFTEAAANAAQNQPLSVQRGQIVLNSLLEIDPDLENNVNLSTVGFGDISPLTCRGTVTGQHTNSRVEVWVKDPIN